MSSGSATPLARKLGIRDDARVHLDGAPPRFEEGLEELPTGVELLRRARRPVDVVVCFCPDRRRLEQRLPRMIELLEPDGGLWIAWPKRSSDLATDLAFDVVQAAGLASGLVDNKVCAVDDTWSALRFVYRLADRPGESETR
ncbi:MAG: DUF3052 domain-containing protein [Thermoanaerobaculia bacterium]|nr:DUF3052 domain-containing protein [Thermoanaerobaculia bacterium]